MDSSLAHSTAETAGATQVAQHISIGDNPSQSEAGMSKAPHRKKLRRYHTPGDLHELTFSCFHRISLLTNDPWRIALSRAIDAAGESCRVDLIAFVYMPEHVHLRVFPYGIKEDVSDYLAALKRPVAVTSKAELERDSKSNALLKRLAVRKAGHDAFRFWQPGAGYDRNLETLAAITASMDYIHYNPVRRGLCTRIDAWRWSSARHYLSDDSWPRISPISAEYWQASSS
jgi:putative transposase